VLDQKVTAKFPTMERLALLHVSKRFPGLKRKGFSGAVRKASDGCMLKSEIGIIPDGWRLDVLPEDAPVCGVFTVIEIEDRHPLSQEKLSRYCHLYDALDFYLYFLRLLVFDRYGQNQRDLDLHEILFSSTVEMARAKRAAGLLPPLPT